MRRGWTKEYEQAENAFIPYSAGIDFRRQNLTSVHVNNKNYNNTRHIMTSNVDPRTADVNIFIMTVDPNHSYSNKSERTN